VSPVAGSLLLAHCIRRQRSAQFPVVEHFDLCGLAPPFVIYVLLFSVVVFAAAARATLPDIVTKVCRRPLGSLAGLVKTSSVCCVVNQRSLHVAGDGADALVDGSDGVEVARAAPRKKSDDARDSGDPC